MNTVTQEKIGLGVGTFEGAPVELLLTVPLSVLPKNGQRSVHTCVCFGFCFFLGGVAFFV